jgi:hypothetical protein
MARGSAGATLVVMTDDLDHGHRATSRLYREPKFPGLVTLQHCGHF